MRVKLVQFDVMNPNGRIYKKENFEPFIDKLNSSFLYGELDHPDRSNADLIALSETSHQISNIRIRGKALYGDITILPTHKGEELKKDIKNRVFRSRGYGSLGEGGIVENFTPITFDAIPNYEDPLQLRKRETWLEKTMREIREEIESNK